MKKVDKAVLITFTAIILILFSVNLFLPGLKYYCISKIRTITNTESKLESYVYENLKADDTFQKKELYGVHVLVPAAFKPIESEMKTTTILGIVDKARLITMAPTESVNIGIDDFSDETDVEKEKYERIKNAFIRLYGSDTISGFDSEKIMFGNYSSIDAFDLTDKYQSFFIYRFPFLQTMTSYMTPEDTTCSIIENQNIKCVVLKMYAEQTLRTMITCYIYDPKDENTMHQFVYICIDETDIENAYKSINSITFNK